VAAIAAAAGAVTKGVTAGAGAAVTEGVAMGAGVATPAHAGPVATREVAKTKAINEVRLRM
jgi:hypothetical protein